jgi:hypothetical protein
MMDWPLAFTIVGLSTVAMVGAILWRVTDPERAPPSAGLEFRLTQLERQLKRMMGL